VTSPILALRAAILARCGADADLAALMGGAVRIHDEPPRASEPVYAVFGGAEARDWSTGSDRGHEQEADLVIWAKAGSAKSALAAAERIAVLLDDAPLALESHRLVNLRVVSIASIRDERSGLVRATLRLRAATEVAA
jgi:hypothetical protein